MNGRLEREAAIVRDLCQPRNLPGASGQVACERTHGSLVFLTDHEVFKLKRAVDFGFFDFTTLAARHRDCVAEVDLNRRTAPSVYLGMLPVRQDARGYSLTRTGGEIVDWAVHMQRLPTACNAATMLREGRLSNEHLDELARCVADFYRGAELHEPAHADLIANCEENFAQAAPFAGRFVAAEVLADLAARQRAWLARHAAQLATRPARDGHGDLRLEHVYFTDAGPLLIDCIEFNDRFRIADPALDLAFLAMDLERNARPDLAATLLSAFAYESDDYGLWPLLDGYASYRAFVRAKVACFVAADPGTPAATAARKSREARELFELAQRLLDARTGARIVAVGGMPASGKSTVARTLRAALAGVTISADATRKYLAGVAKTAAAPPAAYRPEFTAQVVDELLCRTQLVVASGRAAVVDTTFRSRATRARFRELALRLHAPFEFVECTAPEPILRERIRARRSDVSDADEAVLDEFLQHAEPVDELAPAEHSVIDTTEPQQLAALLARLQRAGA